MAYRFDINTGKGIFTLLGKNEPSQIPSSFCPGDVPGRWVGTLLRSYKSQKKKSPKNSKDEWYPSDSIYQTVVEATKNRVGLEYGTVVSQEREQNIAKKKKRKKSYITECM